eukprot:GHVT01020976.1.p1 GENE.GHVT01020976.1~~GHVT01020976.1.p1  ORF type:complete len:596 (-),score=116.94 GHVT01020976.1:835-2622(-)
MAPPGVGGLAPAHCAARSSCSSPQGRARVAAEGLEEAAEGVEEAAEGVEEAAEGVEEAAEGVGEAAEGVEEAAERVEASSGFDDPPGVQGRNGLLPPEWACQLALKHSAPSPSASVHQSCNVGSEAHTPARLGVGRCRRLGEPPACCDGLAPGEGEGEGKVEAPKEEGYDTDDDSDIVTPIPLYRADVALPAEVIEAAASDEDCEEFAAGRHDHPGGYIGRRSSAPGYVEEARAEPSANSDGEQRQPAPHDAKRAAARAATLQALATREKRMRRASLLVASRRSTTASPERKRRRGGGAAGGAQEAMTRVGRGMLSRRVSESGWRSSPCGRVPFRRMSASALGSEAWSSSRCLSPLGSGSLEASCRSAQASTHASVCRLESTPWWTEAPTDEPFTPPAMLSMATAELSAAYAKSGDSPVCLRVRASHASVLWRRASLEGRRRLSTVVATADACPLPAVACGELHTFRPLLGQRVGGKRVGTSDRYLLFSAQLMRFVESDPREATRDTVFTFIQDYCKAKLFQTVTDENDHMCWDSRADSLLATLFYTTREILGLPLIPQDPNLLTETLRTHLHALDFVVLPRRNHTPKHKHAENR